MRGQTTLDFAIGISVFLAVVIAIFAFVPGILTPFTATGQSDAVTVDRTADYLVQDALGGTESPYLLDRGCTVAFFDRTAEERPDDPFADDCRYENASLNDQLGFPDRTTVNVTIVGNVSGGTQPKPLYWDRTDRNLTENTGDVELAIGASLERQKSTTTATRVVRLHGRDVLMYVVVS